MRLAVFTSILVAIGVVGIVIYDRLPPQHSPFAAIDPQRPIGLATARQLGRLENRPDSCRAAVERAGMLVAPIADRRDGEFCGLTGAVAVQRSAIPWSDPPLQLSCPMAAALAVWEKQVVAPAAQRHLGSRVSRIEHFGSYSCRRIGGGRSGRPSEHATGNAIDVGGFRLADGRRVTVRGDWGGDTAAAAFLHDVHDGSCRLFSAVLGPEYNAAHADHLHLDMGPSTICH